MSKSIAPNAANLKPVVCANESEVGSAAFNGVRRRPVVAINEDGELVVCCRRTAKKHGWAIEGALFQRQRSGKVGSEQPAKPGRRASDKTAARVKAAAKVADAVQKQVLEQLLK